MEDLTVCIVSLVIIVFVLFIIRIVTLSMRNVILLRQLKHESRVRAQGNGNACTPPSVPASTGTVMPEIDNPPTYENVMANYINAKEQLCAMEEGGAMAMSASTTTIETCVTEVAASHTDLSADSSNATVTSNETPRPPLQ